MMITKKPRKEQYRLNVEALLFMYANGMSDCGTEDYPYLTLDEVEKYVNCQVYNMIDTGEGLTIYDGPAIAWARELRFIPKKEKLAIIEEVAREAGVLKDELN